MTIKDIPIREGINLAGSICSVIAVFMAFSLTFNIVQWLIIILGFSFGICVFGLFLSCVKYSINKINWLKSLAENSFFLIMIWSLSILAGLFLALLFGWLFGSGCYGLYALARDALLELPQMLY